ncbi:hypothetical protein AVEN_236637-1 [Araneus ventricosus]|uniref:Uncharacterized protein n=1 Tax=Araneus ventricosus TaxID=182803 RepID=A0A4Y2KV96_ARAVE|nr:hypothetical protein AVEN_236637-1 [Araneus ventricosus]
MTANNKPGEPPEENNEQSLPPIEDMNLQDADIEAYMQLNQELDEINNCLDALEKKNDSLHEELFKLLEESRQIRSELKDANSAAT